MSQAYIRPVRIDDSLALTTLLLELGFPASEEEVASRLSNFSSLAKKPKKLKVG